ncbi:MAG: CIA30 family protein [Porticoccaceae bacterium]|nr:CIA30 family protein [Porticoccaceae bacterium]MDG1473726.1 CIA30 family protein [Porticoccaceae bacterium]
MTITVPIKMLLTLLTLTGVQVTQASDNIIIDDFSADSQVAWNYFSDQVMGGVSEGSARLGVENGENFAHLTGDVSTANNGGFIQLRTSLRAGVDKDAVGIYVKVRGNLQKYYIHLRTKGTMLPWQYYQAEFDVTKDWQVIRLPLNSFNASGSWLRKRVLPTSLRSIGIVAYGRNHSADLQVSEIGFY